MDDGADVWYPGNVRLAWLWMAAWGVFAGCSLLPLLMALGLLSTTAERPGWTVCAVCLIFGACYFPCFRRLADLYGASLVVTGDQLRVTDWRGRTKTIPIQFPVWVDHRMTVSLGFFRYQDRIPTPSVYRVRTGAGDCFVAFGEGCNAGAAVAQLEALLKGRARARPGSDAGLLNTPGSLGGQPGSGVKAV